MMMKKSLLVIFLFGAAFLSQAQMYVSPNSYVFVNNELLFVKQDVVLASLTGNDGYVYLRRGGQLMQGVAGNTQNSGGGKMTVYQEGTSDNYDYNYWCSPVGTVASGQEGVLGNLNGNVNSLFYRPVSITSSTAATILPWGSWDGQASPLSISSRWLWKFISSTAYTGWAHIGNGQPLAAGEGFTMKGTAGTDSNNVDGTVANNPGAKQRIDFRGRPNDGDIVIPTLAGQQTLTGNPYPSAIDLSYFLLDNPACDGTAQFWEQDKTVNSHYLANYQGGYGTFTPAATLAQVLAGTAGPGVYTPAIFYSYDGSGNQGPVVSIPGQHFERRFSPVGQGFMVMGVGAGTVTMKNKYRVFVKEGTVTNSDFEKSANSTAFVNNSDSTDENFPPIQAVSGIDYTNGSKLPMPQIRINTLIDNQGVRQGVIVFHPEATDSYDRGMDALSSDDALPSDSFFVIDNKECIISAIAFDEDKRIPVGFKNDLPANYKITVKEIINFEDVSNVYLHDKVNNVYHDIKNGVYELNLPAGTNKTDYEITFKDDNILGVGEDIKNSLVVYQNNASHNLTINNPMLLDINTLVLYDVVGKTIFTKSKLGSSASYEFPTSNLSDGIYIVKMATADNLEISKKIIIKN
ncbi:MULTISPECIES: T9SS type A sorting domain-containing protein [unclassified Flavobacterium]|uniref:T9SS type A sorting domain-containing protein n=1 Tax=unclassified Flavobacterium TaxID=196869 RepID=UPI000A3E9938|nr:MULTISPECIES: T9SS type A sorting domain-containing protein [unclassified Flavobacterium]MBN9283272.1 T9SS type A sorting domain-containing protein [Flavobacterium sp.]